MQIHIQNIPTRKSRKTRIDRYIIFYLPEKPEKPEWMYIIFTYPKNQNRHVYDNSLPENPEKPERMDVYKFLDKSIVRLRFLKTSCDSL